MFEVNKDQISPDQVTIFTAFNVWLGLKKCYQFNLLRPKCEDGYEFVFIFTIIRLYIHMTNNLYS